MDPLVPDASAATWMTVDARGAMPRYRVVAASVQGTSHVRAAIPCQDAYVHAELATGELIIAVADGAGSAFYGGEGAQLAVTTAVDTVCAALAKYRPASWQAWRVVLQSTFDAAQRALYACADERSTAARHLASTLLLLIVTDEAAICGLVGDCAAVIQGTDGTLHSLCQPQRGEYANTTNFIIQPDLAAVLDIQQWPQPIAAAALFSDGLAPLAMNLARNEPHSPFFEPLLAFISAATDTVVAAEQLAAFLDTERVNARTDDDKTLVLVQRLNGYRV